MTTFEFTIIDVENAIQRGYVRGWTKKHASKQIKKDGILIVTLTKVRKQTSFLRSIFKHVSKIDRIIFLRNLMTMMRAGLNLTEALSSSKDQSSNPMMKRIIAETEKAVQSGQTLSSSLAKYPKIFSDVTVAMIRIGERSGKLVDTLEFLVKQQEGDYQLLRKIRNALVYPAMIIATMIVIVIIMMIAVIPKIALIYKEASASLPFFTAAIISISTFIASKGIYVAAGIIAFILLFRYSLRSSPKFRRIIHRLMLRLPLFGLVMKKINLAMISRSLGMLSRSGFSIDEGILLASRVARNMTYREALQSSITFVKRGVRLTDVFRGKPDLFLPLFHKMVMTGEDTGCLDDMFDHVAKYYNDDIQHWTTNISTLIEPILLLLTGIVVGGVAFAILYPLWNFANINI